MRPWWRRPPFGRHGQKVVALGCIWEIVALMDGVPIPTISEIVDKHPWFGWLVLGLLTHHWYIEDPIREQLDHLAQVIEEFRDSPTTSPSSSSDPR